jgi:hypothetical protein
MESRDEILLRALHSSIELSKVTELEAEKVNGLGENLGLPREETAKLVEQLQDEGMVKLHWGGRVSLTQKGRDLASGREAGKANVQVGPGGVYIGSIGAGAEISGAIGQNAVAINIKHAGIGELVAALQELREAQGELSPAEKQVAKELEGQLQTIVQEAEKPNPDKAALERHLDRVKGLMEKLSGIGEAAKKLKPTLEVLRDGLGTLARGLGIAAPWLLG